MNLDSLLEMQESVDRAIRRCIVEHGGYDAERLLIDRAVKQLESLTGAGGSTRAYGEKKLLEVIQRFDNTRTDYFGPWPISKRLEELGVPLDPAP